MDRKWSKVLDEGLRESRHRRSRSRRQKDFKDVARGIVISLSLTPRDKEIILLRALVETDEEAVRHPSARGEFTKRKISRLYRRKCLPLLERLGPDLDPTILWDSLWILRGQVATLKRENSRSQRRLERILRF
jgi:hypothetical protein